MKGLNPNLLRNPDKIDNYWFVPKLNKVHKYAKIPVSERPRDYLAATTIQSYIGNLRQFVKCLLTRSIWAGIRYTSLTQT